MWQRREVRRITGMGLPEKRREADELVEPLFAGLSGAQEEKAKTPGADDSQDAPPDPWKHPRAAQFASQTASADDEAEPSTFPLVMKAVLLLIVLVAIGAFVYLTIGV